MRIPGTALTIGPERHLAAVPGTPAAARAGKPAATAAGADGMSFFTDLMPGGHDTNPELQGSHKYFVYDEMRKTDAAVKSALFMYKLPIRQAVWALDPASEDGVDLLIHDACCWQFGLEEQDGQLDLTWDEWIQQSSQFLEFGSMAEELVEGDVQLWRPTGDDGTNTRILRPFARFAPRFPATIQNIEYDRQTGELTRIRQNLPGTDWIPGDHIAWYAPDRVAGSWYGDSLLRPMYGPWKMKTALLISAAIGWDRYAYGTPVVRFPRGSGKKQEAEQIARDFRTHERAWIVFEGGKPDATNGDGWDIEIVGGAQTIGDPTPLLRHYDEMIAEAALQQFSKLGTTHTGSRAVADTLVDPFYKAVKAYAEYIRDRRQRDALRRFVNVNFGEEYATPKLRVSRIQAKNVMLFAQAISLLAAAGLSFTDRDTQDDIRDDLDMRHLPETQQAVDGLPEDVGVAREGDGLPVAA